MDRIKYQSSKRCYKTKVRGVMLEMEEGLVFRLSLLLGVVSRVVIAPFTGYGFDIEILKFATRTYYEGSGIAIFKNWTDPPLLYYILLFSYSFYFLLHYKLGIPDFYPFAHGTGALEVFFLKLPFILADICIFLLLRKSLSLLELGERESLMLSNIYFLSPYVLMITTAHGMWDSLATVFLVLGFYFMIKWQQSSEEEHYIYYATLAFVAAFGVKWVGLAPLFVLFSLLVGKGSYSKLVKVILLSVTTVLAFYIPFFFHGIGYLLDVFHFRTAGGLLAPNTSNFFQTLYLLGVPPRVIKALFLPFYSIFLGILFCTILYLVRKKRIGSQHLSEFQAFSFFTLIMITIFYLLYYKVHPQIFIWFVALAPYFLSIKKIKLEVRERFRFYYLLFVFVMGVFLVTINGRTILFGNPHPNRSYLWTGITRIIGGILTTLFSIYFAYITFLMGRGVFPLLKRSGDTYE